jgi:pimeloyl-ACP methyl ester carboxylesterase
MRIGRVLGAIALGVVAVGAVAFAVLQRPDLDWTTLDARYRDADSRMADMGGGVVVRYRDQGRRDAPVLVLVHGFSASAADWDGWVRHLASQYRVITLDLPGHGLTRAPADWPADPDHYADLVDAVVTRLVPGKFVLAGNSMGGAVAWHYALRHGDRLAGLVLVDAAGAEAPADARKAQRGGPIIFRLLANPVGRTVLARIDLTPMIRQGLESAFVDRSLVTPDLVARYADLARAPGHRAIMMHIVSARPMAASDADLAAIKVPTLVMHGTDDRLIPYRDGQRFARTIPGAQLVTYTGVGHVPMEQVPDRSADDLDHWLHAKVWPH